MLKLSSTGPADPSPSPLPPPASTSQHVLEANFTIMDTKECEDIYIENFREHTLRLRYPNLLQNTDIICAIDDVSDACQVRMR